MNKNGKKLRSLALALMLVVPVTIAIGLYNLSRMSATGSVEKELFSISDNCLLEESLDEFECKTFLWFR